MEIYSMTMNRRHFLSTSLSFAAASSLRAITPINRQGRGAMQLGVAAYSFREYFQWSRGKEQKVPQNRQPWTILDFIDWCSDHQVPGAEVTSYFFPPDVDKAFLLEVRRHAYLRGVQLAGTAVGNNFALPKGDKLDEQIADVKKWIDYSAIMGAPHIRVFAGPVPKDIGIEEAVANCTAAYQECLDYAAEKGIFLGLENHGGIVAEPENLIQMVSAAKSPWAGINFDSGNFHTEDPYGDLAKIAPYAINVQLKMVMRPKGVERNDPGEPTDIPRVLKILKDANYQGWFTIEFEEKKDPFEELPKLVTELRKLLQAA